MSREAAVIGRQRYALPALLAGARRGLFVRLALIGGGHAVLVVLTALAGRYGLDQVSGAGGLGTGQLVALLGALALGASLAHLVQVRERRMAEALAQDFITDSRLRLFDQLNAMAPNELQRRSRGVMMIRFVADLNALSDWASQGLSRLAVAAPAGLVALAALAWISPPIALGLCLGVAVLAAAIAACGPALYDQVRETRRRRGTLAANLGDKLGAGSPVQAFARARGERNRLARHSSRLGAALVRQSGLEAHLRFLPEAAVPLATALLLLASRGAEAVSAGDLLATLVILGLLAAPLGDLARGFVHWQNYRVARDVLGGFFALPTLAEAGGKLRVRRGEVALEQVEVAGVLNGASAVAAPGQMAAITGGDGKSTLLALVARLRDPDRGAIRIDGQDLARCTPESVRRAVSLLSPEMPLLRGSLRRNLTYRRRGASEREISRVLARCGLEGAVAALPRGLDTRVAENGANLPGGVRQRLQVARAILDDPPVLLVDDADGFHDPAARAALQRLAARRRRTVLMVTRDPGTLRSADAVWRLDGGKLQVAGPDWPGLDGTVVPLRAAGQSGHPGGPAGVPEGPTSNR